MTHAEKAKHLVQTASCMGLREKLLTATTIEAVLNVIDAAGNRIVHNTEPSIADVKQALHDDGLIEEALEQWNHPGDAQLNLEERLRWHMAWLAEYLPQHIREEQEPPERT